jgi:peptidoglycan-associated lipoprotein
MADVLARKGRGFCMPLSVLILAQDASAAEKQFRVCDERLDLWTIRVPSASASVSAMQIVFVSLIIVAPEVPANQVSELLARIWQWRSIRAASTQRGRGDSSGLAVAAPGRASLPTGSGSAQPSRRFGLATGAPETRSNAYELTAQSGTLRRSGTMYVRRTGLIIELILTGALALGCSHAKPEADPRLNLAGRAQANPSPKEKTSSVAQTASEDTSARQGPNERAVYFPFDSARIEDGDKPALQAVAREAKGSRIRIEGNCDERGTTEYNLALGDRRARSAAEYLERLGVPARRIDFVSYGSERPKDPGHDNAAWARNRRDDIFIR